MHEIFVTIETDFSAKSNIIICDNHHRNCHKFDCYVELQSDFDSSVNNCSCKVEAGCNSGWKKKNAINCRKVSVQFPGRNTKQMDYVKEVESGINKQNAEGGAKGPREKTSIQKNARAAARIELKNGRTSKRRRRDERVRGEGELAKWTSLVGG